jgi:hypothetical protein
MGRVPGCRFPGPAGRPVKTHSQNQGFERDGRGRAPAPHDGVVVPGADAVSSRQHNRASDGRRDANRSTIDAASTPRWTGQVGRAGDGRHGTAGLRSDTARRTCPSLGGTGPGVAAATPSSRPQRRGASSTDVSPRAEYRGSVSHRDSLGVQTRWEGSTDPRTRYTLRGRYSTSVISSAALGRAPARRSAGRAGTGWNRTVAPVARDYEQPVNRRARSPRCLIGSQSDGERTSRSSARGRRETPPMPRSPPTAVPGWRRRTASPSARRFFPHPPLAAAGTAPSPATARWPAAPGCRAR